MKTRRQIVDAREPSGTSPDDPVWRRLREIVSAINGSDILAGRMLSAEDNQPDGSGLVFTAGQTRTFAHKLGRKARGWIEVYGADAPSAARVGLFSVAPTSISSTSEHYITVKATSAGRCLIWVY